MGSSASSVDSTMNSMMFQPPKNIPPEAFKELQTPYSKLVEIKSDSGKISAVVISPKLKQDDQTPIKNFIVFSHGNATNIYSMYPYCLNLANKTNSVTCVYDFPGYGLSEGSPTEKGCYD